ncbi:hypothetical protein L9F63_027577, partial [Diploptera punctata]
RSISFFKLFSTIYNGRLPSPSSRAQPTPFYFKVISPRWCMIGTYNNVSPIMSYKFNKFA